MQKRFVESFTGMLRDELVNPAWFHTLAEAKMLIEVLCDFCNERRPHSD